MSGLSAAVTAGGMFLSTMVAALVSASASAAGAAPAVSDAFPKLRPAGLGEAKILKKDWHAAAVTASKLSSAVMVQVYDELEHEQKELGYVIYITSDVASKIHDGALDDTVHWFNKPWAAVRGPNYKQKQQILRALGYLLELIERTQSTRSQFRKDADNLKLQLELMMQLDGEVDDEVDDEVDSEVDSEEDDDAGDLGKFFQKGINKLNQKFDSGSAGGGTVVAAKDGNSEASREEAAFIKNLHTAQGAGSMFRGAFDNAGERLTGLSKALEEQEKWVSGQEQRMRQIRGRLGSAEGAELQALVKEVLSLSEEWRSRIRSSLYKPGE